MNAATPDAINQRCDELLRRLAGDSARLRDDQRQAIHALAHDRKRVLVVQRTGWGKSAVYFLAAKLLREHGSGPTILVSPLLALMRDQLRAANRMGLVAATINSSNTDEWQEIEKRIANDEVDLLAISPERLNNPKFVDDVLPRLTRGLGMVVIDEAHCISQWGHDFRPDYMRIRYALEHVPPSTPVLATTATATDWVVKDVADQLGVAPLTLRGSLDRPSLRLSVIDLDTPAHRLAWLAHHIPQLPGSGIVYCLTQSAAEQTSSWLKSQGIASSAYSGATAPEQREKLEAALQNNQLKVLCATSALGMGFDKPDLAFAINLGAPSSITSYYQMVGRAGRALDQAEGVLLPGKEDQRIWSWFDQVSFPPRALAEAVVRQLSDEPTTEPRIEARVDIKRTRLQALLKVLDVEGAVTRTQGGWVRTTNEWEYNEARYQQVRNARREDQKLMLDYQSATTCRMAHLRNALDDPELGSQELEDKWSCGRCDNCCEPRFATPPAELVAKADETTRNVEIVLPARKMWPAGIARGGTRIKADRQAVDGRALCEAGGLGWTVIVDAVLNNDDAAANAVASADLVKAVGRCLKQWTWPEGRPTWITAIPSVRHPNLARSIADELGRQAKLPVVVSLNRTREAPPQSQMSNSAHAAANVGGAFEVIETNLPQGPGLVIDDTWQSGWTMTAVADLLREAGADAIYPFVLQKV